VPLVLDSVVLPVPQRLLALYAVAAPRRADAAVLATVADPAAGLVVSALPAEQAPLPPASLLRAMGSTSESIGRLEEAASVVVVQGLGDAGWPPTHELAARRAAARLAGDSDGVVVDLAVPRVLADAAVAGAAQAEVAEALETFRLVDWLLLPYSVEPGGLWFTTKGMHRFGVPELQSRGVPERYRNAWGAVLSGIGQVLLSDHWRALSEQPEIPFREVAAEHCVSLRDVASAYSDRAQATDDPALDASAWFRIELDPATHEGADSFVTIGPPSGFAGEASAWCRSVVSAVFGARS
jgi:hypothetical protein